MRINKRILKDMAAVTGLALLEAVAKILIIGGLALLAGVIIHMSGRF